MSDLPMSVCRHCGRHIVLYPVGWSVTAHYVPPEKYHDEAAWMACEKAPAVTGFLGRHEASGREIDE